MTLCPASDPFGCHDRWVSLGSIVVGLATKSLQMMTMTLTESDSLLEEGWGREGDAAIPRGSLATAVLRIRRELSDVSSGEGEGGGAVTGSGSIRIPSWMASGMRFTPSTSFDDQAPDGFPNPSRGSRPQGAHTSVDGDVGAGNSSAASDTVGSACSLPERQSSVTRSRTGGAE